MDTKEQTTLAERHSACVPDQRVIEDLRPNQTSRRPTEEQRKYIDSLWLLCLLTVVAAISNRPAASFDGDLWSHLRTGRWILEQHALPAHDVFAWPTMGKAWIDYTWLFDVLVSKIYGFAGLHGMLAFSMLMMLACVAGLVMLLMLYTTLLRAIAIAAVAFVALIPLESPRPWLFTILFFIGELYLLLQARERGKPSSLLLVLPLFILWANIHIQFVYGLALIGLFALERSVAPLLKKWTAPVARLRPVWFWALLPASVLATLANPYGWTLYGVVAEYARQRVPLWFIQEMHPLQFRNFTDWAALLLICSAIFAMASTRKNSPLILALLAASCVVAFRCGRDVWLLAIASSVSLAYSTRTLGEGTRPFRWIYWAIALPLSLALAFAMVHSTDESALQKAAAKQFPEKASSFIQSHALQNPLHNPFSWGGYLIWRLPNMPVSIDGRANLHGDIQLARFADTWLGRKDWANDPELMEANTILLERDCALASILRSDSRFRLLYEDELASVFQPIGTALPKAP